MFKNLVHLPTSSILQGLRQLNIKNKKQHKHLNLNN
jgi:hypothetical protein